MNSWGYGNSNTAALFLQISWQPPFFFVCIPSPTIVHSRWQIINWYWWGDFYKLQCLTRQIHNQQCLTCQIHNPRRTIFVPKGLRLPSETFENLQLDFIQLPLSMSYQYVHYCIYVFYMDWSLPLISTDGATLVEVVYTERIYLCDDRSP